MEGLNLTHLIHSVCTKMSLIQTINIQSAPNGIGLILAARIKGHMKNALFATILLKLLEKCLI